jgi:hypothetical protein
MDVYYIAMETAAPSGAPVRGFEELVNRAVEATAGALKSALTTLAQRSIRERATSRCEELGIADEGPRLGQFA